MGAGPAYPGRQGGEPSPALWRSERRLQHGDGAPSQFQDVSGLELERCSTKRERSSGAAVSPWKFCL